MSVALASRVMRLSEILTIYLAAAAPTGVAYFLRRPANAYSTPALFKATGAALCWPLTLLLSRRATRSSEIGHRIKPSHQSVIITSLDEAGITRAERALIASLHELEERACEAFGNQHAQEQRRLLTAIRACVEGYAGLTHAIAGTRADDAPSEREMEICRVAGRTGDDLLIAGRCIHRRHVARLRAHQAHARAELIHALASMNEWLKDGRFTLPLNLCSARRLAEAQLRADAHAVELLSLLEDQSAVMDVARLLNASCARLRQLTRVSPQDAQINTVGDETCPTRTFAESLSSTATQTTSIRSSIG